MFPDINSSKLHVSLLYIIYDILYTQGKTDLNNKLIIHGCRKTHTEGNIKHRITQRFF
jgi:hypothetical protein